MLKSPTRNWQINDRNIDGVATTTADFNTSPMSYCSPYTNDGNIINK